MPNDNQIRVRTKGRGARLEVYSGGRWHSIQLDRSNQRTNKHKPAILSSAKTLRREAVRVSTPNTQVGLSGGDKESISLKTRITYLKGEATNKKAFELPMGVNGQEKILIVQETTGGTQFPEITLKTQQDDATKYTSAKKGQVLHLICDGTYWYLVSTGYSTSGSDDVGEWTTS